MGGGSPIVGLNFFVVREGQFSCSSLRLEECMGDGWEYMDRRSQFLGGGELFCLPLLCLITEFSSQQC